VPPPGRHGKLDGHKASGQQVVAGREHDPLPPSWMCPIVGSKVRKAGLLLRIFESLLPSDPEIEESARRDPSKIVLHVTNNGRCQSQSVGNSRLTFRVFSFFWYEPAPELLGPYKAASNFWPELMHLLAVD
jgi:hypothetical protein